jgi:hypothetical protein
MLISYMKAECRNYGYNETENTANFRPIRDTAPRTWLNCALTAAFLRDFS